MPTDGAALEGRVENNNEELSSHCDAHNSHRPINPERPQKRQRTSGARMAYPRKRAVTACQLCRTRKTKCDNLRPSCGSCTTLSVECRYQDTNSDHSSFDQASLTILQRLNYAVQLLENQSQLLLLPSLYASPSSHLSGNPTENANARVATVPSIDSTSPGYLLDNSATTLHDTLEVSANCSSTAILRWPIFEGAINPDSINRLFFDPESLESSPSEVCDEECTHSASPQRSSTICRGIQESDVPGLIQDFLHNVHTKNPILDSAALISHARKIAEDGFKWDGFSCLVLIACALANLARPFDIETTVEPEKSYASARDYPTAETYYTAARKRIGLLDNSVIATQCAFLIGVYEMYSLRPFKAWISFNRACTTFQAYLHTRSDRAESTHATKRLEQRLYWSCLKSECEMRDEIDLPPTGLAKVEYPDVFPSPPGGTPEPEDTAGTPNGGVLQAVSQRSWYYYLSEIAYRRISNRILHSLHRAIPESWTSTNLIRLQRIAEELDAQVVQWWEHIPESLRLAPGASSDELTHMLKSRLLEMRERVWRPFLYIVVHNSCDPDELPKCKIYAERCLGLALETINHLAVRHRHHGTWFAARQMFAKGLLVLAVFKAGSIALPTPDWVSAVGAVKKCLSYWEDEAPDLHVVRLLISQIYDGVDGEI